MEDWFFSDEVISAATTYGLATHDQFDEWRSEVEDWSNQIGAVGGLAFAEVIAFKPGN